MAVLVVGCQECLEVDRAILRMTAQSLKATLRFLASMPMHISLEYKMKLSRLKMVSILMKTRMIKRWFPMNSLS